MAHDVFISYAHKDKPTGDAVCATLEGRGIRCWMAPRDILPGSNWGGSIVEAIHASRVFVLVFSAEANISPHVLRELERAVNDGTPVLPLRIEDVPLSPSMEYFISTPHWLDALTPPLEQHLVQLAETVKLLLQRADAATEAKRAAATPPPAPESPPATPLEPVIAVPAPAIMAPLPAGAPPAQAAAIVTAPAPAPSSRVLEPKAPSPIRTAGPASTGPSAARAIPVRMVGGLGGLAAIIVIGVIAASSMSGRGGTALASPTSAGATSSVGPVETHAASVVPIVSPTPTRQIVPAHWTTTGSLSVPRTEHAAALLPDGKVLVAGGYEATTDGPPGAPLASAELFDPATGRWTLTGSMSTPRAQATMTLLPNGKVLVAGGWDQSENLHPLATAELYDPASGTWSKTGAMALRHAWHVAVLLTNGKVLVTGGFNVADGPTARAELYDPASGIWRATGSMHLGRFAFAAVLLADGSVLVIGSGGPPGNDASAEVYKPGTGKWTVTGSMSTGRADHTATLLPDGRVFVAGGTTDLDSGGSLASAELWDPTTGGWEATAPMPAGRKEHTSTLLQDGSVLLAGGSTDTTEDKNAGCVLFQPATGSWATAPSIEGFFTGHTATLLADGGVLVAGNGASTEVFYPTR